MFGSFAQSPLQTAALEQVETWVRERYSLAPGNAVLVTELACALPGCPPLETVIAFWTATAQRHQTKIFKPVQQVQPDDLPPYWMKSALAVSADFAGDCC